MRLRATLIVQIQMASKTHKNKRGGRNSLDENVSIAKKKSNMTESSDEDDASVSTPLLLTTWRYLVSFSKDGSVWPPSFIMIAFWSQRF